MRSGPGRQSALLVVDGRCCMVPLFRFFSRRPPHTVKKYPYIHENSAASFPYFNGTDL